MEEAYQEILKAIGGIWRHRKAALGTAWLVVVIGTAVVAMQKDVYESTTRVYVDTASQLRVLLGDQIVDSNIEEQLRYVREAILGRRQLETVAKESGLLPADASPQQTINTIAEIVRQRLRSKYSTI